jgi:hypothetical protein
VFSQKRKILRQEAAVARFRTLFLQPLAKSEENHEYFHLEQPVPWQRSEAGTSQMQTRAEIILWYIFLYFPASAVIILTRLQAGRVGFDSWRRQRRDIFFSPPHPGRLWSAPSLPYNWYRGLFLRSTMRTCVKLTAHPHLVPRLRMCGVIHPFPNTSSKRGVYLSTRKISPSNYFSVFSFFYSYFAALWLTLSWFGYRGKHREAESIFRVL